jgi:hypothetical protein
MVSVVRGDLGPLRDIWRDAYGAPSRARNLEIVGYSMLDDDAGIRTPIRAGVIGARSERRSWSGTQLLTYMTGSVRSVSGPLIQLLAG